MSSFLKKIINNKPPSHQSRGSSSNPYKNSNQGAAPPAYTPVLPSGQNASYYGTSPQPQYPPMPQQMHQPPPPQQMYPSQGPPPPGLIHPGTMPMPGLINPGTMPLPSMNPGADDPYVFLRDFDTVILVDDSGSMSGGRWNQTAQALGTIVPIVTYYDSDGIDIYFLNARDHPSHHNIKTPSQVMEVFGTVRPQGATPTGRALKSILEPYMQRFERSPNRCKPLNIIVITDGVPTDDVESHIIKYARKLDRLDADLTQVGIQFFQIGSDPEATAALRELDDALGDGEMRDMVDTVPFTGSLEGDRMLKVVLGAVNRRLDRKRV
ncbi:hypothetical protein DRE_03446 [Drechslerella stenobrocha 248]|uniref:VWFA domain-containing protein n=1 Tax=Drechslerella stenobrocha 248 TaxID=1043628 RepID=W7I3U9_9PEZI|nr:hypothetical protein DRE_03446 [Drechslerella stenobrocha 248]